MYFPQIWKYLGGPEEEKQWIMYPQSEPDMWIYVNKSRTYHFYKQDIDRLNQYRTCAITYMNLCENTSLLHLLGSVCFGIALKVTKTFLWKIMMFLFICMVQRVQIVYKKPLSLNKRFLVCFFFSFPLKL